MSWIFVSPPNKISQTHVDPLGTPAWMIMIEGIKKWRIFVAKDMAHFVTNEYCQSDGTFPDLFSMSEPFDVAGIYYESEIKEGDFLYIPPFCVHGIENKTNTLAVTHNFFGFKIPFYMELFNAFFGYLTRYVSDKCDNHSKNINIESIWNELLRVTDVPYIDNISLGLLSVLLFTPFDELNVDELFTSLSRTIQEDIMHIRNKFELL